MDSQDGTKTCPDCGVSKQLSEFGLNRRVPDGRARYRKAGFRIRSTASCYRKKAEQGKTVRERIDVPEARKTLPAMPRDKADPLRGFYRKAEWKFAYTHDS
ncbi:hypothetical protein N5079_33115 [Planotetraspora sp. A-T 1434]|uniref:hypothetical protein n=1 Tax=Planotetraspora sp. A-T 1434 TaxID=2979219 RepID=UPI0021C032C8|nr:hypothetical protein [Planotetraspora sp. A-T 1434]MCT9935056.1 hypothetical protein [Planotetraspora sp. A-T 1434]